jgi:hypothetical protein
MAREVIAEVEQMATLAGPVVSSQLHPNSCGVKREMSTLSVHIHTA